MQVGDHVVAKRKIKSATEPNTVIGPIHELDQDTCYIITNEGDPIIEGHFRLRLSEWKFWEIEIDES